VPTPRSCMQAGDHIIYSKFAGTDITVGEDQHVLLKVKRGAEHA